MAHYLYPTLEQTLSCPKRYTLEKVQRKDVPAPFMTSELGNQVHSRIAHSLRTGKPANEQEFCLPRRLLLNQRESADTLMIRAYDCLHNFNEYCRPWLDGLEVIAVEQKLCFKPHWFDEPVTISGRIDAVLKTSDGLLLLDWKTGGMIRTDEQLRWYVALYTMNNPNYALEARAINLLSSETVVVKDFVAPQTWLYEKVKALMTALNLAQQEPMKAVAGQQCHYCAYAEGCGPSKAKPRTMLDTFDGEVIALA
jgi:PD-(D/E)XK nuclease superfamily